MKTDVPQKLTPKNASEKRKSANIQRTPSIGWAAHSSDWDAPKAALAAAASMLEAKNLNVLYGPNQILTNVSFTLKQGDTLGLLGLNGAGKSTLLKVLAGALAPQSGTVQIGENELYQNPLPARMDIGYAPDKPATYPEFRVMEFLKFMATMRRIPKAQIKTSISNVIERCALGDVERRVIGNLSTGYQQRVNLAQALIHSPKILILDEPATGLDPVQLIEMRELVSTLSSEQATIFSSHSLHEVSSVCNRILLIHSGENILDAPLDQLSNESNITFDLKLQDAGDADIAKLPGVQAACRISSTHWMVTGDAKMAQHLKTMLLARGQKVLSMDQTDNYLETLFRQLGTTQTSNSRQLDLGV